MTDDRIQMPNNTTMMNCQSIWNLASVIWTLPFPGGWSLDPEGAAVHEGERAAVIADVHLGYEWARGSGGDVVPSHSLAETLGRLERLLGRAGIGQLIVA